MNTKVRKSLLASFAAILLMSSFNPVLAKEKVKEQAKKEEQTEAVEKKEVYPDLGIESESVVLYDMKLKKIVYQKNPDSVIPTASLAKIMTLSIASDKLKNSDVKNTDEVTISEKAWKTGGSRMFIEVGKQVPFGELFKGVAVISGNDAAVSIAEHISGSTEEFVKEMNAKAAELKMNNTTFETVNGLPIDGLMDVSTAKDLTLLTIDYLKKYPDNLKIHSMKSYAFDNGRNVIEQKNRNPLLKSYEGADGLKTGWIEGHHNLIGTAQGNGIRLIAVIMSSPSEEVRAQDAKKLLDYGFSQYRVYSFADKDELVEKVTVYKAKDIKKTSVVYENKTEITIHNMDAKKIKQKIDIPDYITGGKKKGDVIGSKKIYLGDEVIETINIVLTEDLPKSNLITTIFDSIALVFNKITSKLF